MCLVDARQVSQPRHRVWFSLAMGGPLAKVHHGLPEHLAELAGLVHPRDKTPVNVAFLEVLHGPGFCRASSW